MNYSITQAYCQEQKCECKNTQKTTDTLYKCKVLLQSTELNPEAGHGGQGQRGECAEKFRDMSYRNAKPRASSSPGEGRSRNNRGLYLTSQGVKSIFKGHSSSYVLVSFTALLCIGCLCQYQTMSVHNK